VGADGDVTVISDCRNLFPPLTAMEQLLYVSGDGQDAAPNALLPQPLAVRVALGDLPVPGCGIRFEIESGGGTLAGAGSSFETVTDSDGHAQCDWRLGAGAVAPARFQRVRASLLNGNGQPMAGQYLVFCATASLGLRYVSGDSQDGAPGTPLPFPLEMQVVNGADGIPGVALRAAVEQGGGTIIGPALVTTDAQGQASFQWQIGSAGSQRVRVELLDGTGQVVQRLSFDASIAAAAGPGTTRGCEVTIGAGGDFEKLTVEILRSILEKGKGSACLCFLPGTQTLPVLEISGQGQFRLSMHGCGHTSVLNLEGPVTFNAFASIELRDLAMHAEGETRLLFQKNTEVRIANVQFDRSTSQAKSAALSVLGAQTVSLIACEILTRLPTMAAVFQDIEGVCRVLNNRFVGLVSFYGESGVPSPALLKALAARDNLRLTPGAAQLSFCDNQLSLLSVAAAMAANLSAPTGTVTGVFASAILEGNTFIEQNSLFVAGLLGVNSNAFVAQPAPDAMYGVMMAMRATAAGNLAVAFDDGASLHFVVPNAASFAKAANEVFVLP